MRSSTFSTVSPNCSHGAVPPCRMATQQRRLDTAKRLQQLICLVVLLSLATLSSVSGQGLAPTRKVSPNELVEKYDNPPAPARKIETSPRMISQFGVFTSYQVNVDANHQNIIGDAANECVISVDPTDGNKMTIAWRQFNDVNSNFRQGGWGYTTDGGMLWTFPGEIGRASCRERVCLYV